MESIYPFFERKIREISGISFPRYSTRERQGFIRRAIIARIGTLGMDESEYFAFMARRPRDHTEWRLLLDQVRIGKTRFFRHIRQFSYLKKELLPEMKKRGHARIWSAACSTGEEPYSLSMLLKADAPGLNYRIFASDLNEDSLRFARFGIYPGSGLRGVPAEIREKYAPRLAEGSRYREIEASIRKRVSFLRLNLTSDPIPFTDLDAVFCENVFYYFSKDAIASVLTRLWKACRSGGFLFISKWDDVSGVEHPWRRISSGIYRK